MKIGAVNECFRYETCSIILIKLCEDIHLPPLRYSPYPCTKLENVLLRDGPRDITTISSQQQNRRQMEASKRSKTLRAKNKLLMYKSSTHAAREVLTSNKRGWEIWSKCQYTCRAEGGRSMKWSTIKTKSISLLKASG